MSMAVCLMFLTLAPMIIVVGYETVGHRHQAVALERVLAATGAEG